MAEVVMSAELYKAAMEGNVRIFTNQREGTTNEEADIDRYFLSHTLEEKNNILHVSAVHQNDKSLNFVKEALERFPALVSHINSNGENPLHVYARYGNKEAVQLLVECFKNNVTTTTSEFLWRVQNLQGDTPLHVALKRGQTEVALFFINLDDGLASIVNHFYETPLHLAASFSIARKSGLSSPSVSKVQEDLLCVIELLLNKESSAASKRDADALTPLLRASSCRNCIPVILAILDHNPQLAEQRDLKGRTMLHLLKLLSYEEWKRALKISVVKALKDEQDVDGNTPVLLAIQDSDFLKVRVLMECSVDFQIKNRHGFSAWDLIETQDDFLKNLKDEMDRGMNGLMKKELYKAVVEGSIEFLSQHEDVYLVSRSMNGNNVLHIAMSPESVDKREFVEVVLERLPILICQTNADGDTPLHLAARSKTLAAFVLMTLCRTSFQKALELGSLYLDCPPWRARNSKGNTPLHEALLAGNAVFARFLIQIDDEVASFVNNSNETPLHLCARYKQVVAHDFETSTLPECAALRGVNELDLLLSANISAAFLTDVDGFTPLLRAARSNQHTLATKILQCCPRSAAVCDFDGRTLLHHMPLSHKRQLSFDGVDELIMAQDFGGNTPLHVAIKNRNFNKVKILVQNTSRDGLRTTVNNKGESAFDLIRLQTEVPEEIRQLFRSVNPYRSLYGICETDKKETVNTLLVIAALLTTITFAAAFTVSGGFDQNKGTPILINKASFKVFLISDTWALCCSMMALFALQWVMTGGPRESMKLIDLSIFALQVSFYATTVAFMTGVYAATSSETIWMAILVCVLCSCLMILSIKPIVWLLAILIAHVLEIQARGEWSRILLDVFASHANEQWRI